MHLNSTRKQYFACVRAAGGKVRLRLKQLIYQFKDDDSVPGSMNQRKVLLHNKFDLNLKFDSLLYSYQSIIIKFSPYL